MQQNAFKNVCFIGLGAIGAKYASMIHDVFPNDLKILANAERIQRYTNDAVFVNGKKYDFKYVDIANPTFTADIIFIAVKSTQLNQALADIKPFISDNTIILSLLNGVSTANAIANVVGNKNLLYSIIYMDAVRDKNQITYKSKGRFLFGEAKNDTHTERVKSVMAFFDKVDINYEVPADMQLALWQKYLINIVVNQLSFIVQSGYQIFKDNTYVLSLTQLIGEETLKVANAYGVNLQQSDIDALKKTMLKIDGKASPSMHQDRQAGRLSEVDIFSGELIRLAKAKNVDVPYNTFIYNLIKAIEFEEIERSSS